jgi:hypothetical protein
VVWTWAGPIAPSTGLAHAATSQLWAAQKTENTSYFAISFAKFPSSLTFYTERAGW